VPETVPNNGDPPKWYLTSQDSWCLMVWYEYILLSADSKLVLEIPIGSVPDVVNDIVPLNVAELPLKPRFKRLKLISDVYARSKKATNKTYPLMEYQCVSIKRISSIARTLDSGY
jgi:hypothetical protein